FGVQWCSKFYFSVRLTFSCRSSPKIFDALSEALCWILLNNYSIPFLLHLLDDFLLIDFPHASPAQNLTILKSLFSNLCIPLASEKTLGPLTSIEFLGFTLDSQSFSALLPCDCMSLVSIISTFLSGPPPAKHSLLSLLGHLNYAMRIIPQGRDFISYLLLL
ncbi:hypothetical protein AOXY_G771, partial [Acipenser oxyrinchus oxyrinchus]